MQRIQQSKFTSEQPIRTSVRPPQILMADDDPSEHLLMTIAAEEAETLAEFTFVADGIELLTVLNHQLAEDALPDLIVLDLRMPRLDGHRVLIQLQAHPVLWQIPVVVFSTLTSRDDIERCFRAGARWVESKPDDFSAMVEFARSISAKATHRSYAFDSPEQMFTRRSTIDIDLTDFDI